MTEAMAVEIPGVFGLADPVGEAVIHQLIAAGSLPPDFYFRLLAFDDMDERTQVATTDVMAALGFNPESDEAATYLHGDLPDCVYVPGRDGHLRAILRELDDDYHILYDLCEVALSLEIDKYIAQQTWQLLIEVLNPNLHSQIQELMDPLNGRMAAGISKRYQHSHALGRTVIRDQAMVGVYTGEIAVRDIGPVRQRLLYHLLLDNHPEFEAENPDIS